MAFVEYFGGLHLLIMVDDIVTGAHVIHGGWLEDVRRANFICWGGMYNLLSAVCVLIVFLVFGVTEFMKFGKLRLLLFEDAELLSEGLRTLSDVLIGLSRNDVELSLPVKHAISLLIIL